jgi:tetratricopeptide (TPR) repeat protein
MVLAKLNRFDEAIASYNKALSINPKLADAHFNLGNTMRGLGKLEKAAASFRQALAIKPELSEATGTLGSVLLSMGDSQEGLAMEKKGFGVIEFSTNRGVSINQGSSQ